MKHRVLLLSILLAVVAAGAALASGQQDGSTLPWKTVTLTGKVSFTDWPNPELTSGGKTYELMVPRFATVDLNVQDGQTVTVEGYLAECGMYAADSGKLSLRVTKATIDGKEYTVPTGPDGYRGGPMMGRGAQGRGDWGRGSRGGMRW